MRAERAGRRDHLGGDPAEFAVRATGAAGERDRRTDEVETAAAEANG
ncbi:hypothetical protein PSA01_26750 [Pseudonocardia saturnea]|uniref:Uncharacterized protein n=1 Tax=Pseudonocardia saturnea TaxID=33909 RepID=A0ABQ0RYA9_9PSEU|nr:hypothetical protein PSA01_26750 [Pseudonocardia saturnea]